FSCLLWYSTTESFQRMVRSRLTSEIEQATGGRVEIGSFHVIPLKLEVEVRDLTIHGREPSGQLPYVHVDSVLATVKLHSALGGRLGFHSLTVVHPVVHVIFFADGTSNTPTPEQRSQPLSFDHLFSVSIDRLQVRKGELILQDQRLPLDFTTSDLSADLYYSFLRFRYFGNIEIGRAETQFDGYRPVPWAGKASFSIDHDGVQLQSLQAHSGASGLQFNGGLADFRAPVIKGSYKINLDLAEAGSVSRQ